MGMVISDALHVTPDWLTQVLHQAQVLDHGRVATVAATSVDLPGISRFVRLTLTFSETQSQPVPAHLFLKLSPPPSDGLKPFVHNNEVAFYHAMEGVGADLPLCRCYDAASDPQTNAYHLLLDDVSLTHYAILWGHVPPRPRQCEQMVDALAAIHAFWWDHPQLGTGLGALPTRETEASGIQRARTTYPAFADVLGECLSAERRGIFERVLSALPRLAVRLTQGGQLTLVHGDAHCANFLFPHEEHRGVRIVDWDWFRISVGPMDLAYQMGLMWFPEQRARFEQALVRRYHDRLLYHGVEGYDWHQCWDDYRFSVIQLLLLPVWRWSVMPWPDSWWLLLEKVLWAYHDLGCADLLEP